eukprot:m.25471 g.25471  ORF g.25471 m.25471 type:complete len:59 (-) comp9861_c0_seq1:2323-2499(-)
MWICLSTESKEHGDEKDEDRACDTGEEQRVPADIQRFFGTSTRRDFFLFRRFVSAGGV